MPQRKTIPHVLLITGVPGVGKTTVLRRVSQRLGAIRICGFYTEELREHGSRRGFRLVGFEGEEGIIAHVDLPQRCRIGRYGVDVAALDRLSQATLALDRDCALYLVDEIGRMECLSNGFVSAMHTLLDAGAPMVATIGKKGSGFIAEVKARNDIEMWEVTQANRDELPDQVIGWLAKQADAATHDD